MIVIKAGVIITLIGAGPLMLYALVGPADGNPVGLGLLFVVVTPIGLVVLAIGLVIGLWRWLTPPPPDHNHRAL